MVNKKNISGLSLNDDLVFVSDTRVLNKSTGTIISVEEAFDLLDLSSAIEINDRLEVVTGVDNKRIDLSLGTSEGKMTIKNGFLIEVFLSGSDGKLTRLYKDDFVDSANDETLSRGFSNYFTLEVDEE